MKRETQTVCLDSHARIHRGETVPLSPNAREDSARLHPAAQEEKLQMIDQLIRGHYTSY